MNKKIIIESATAPQAIGTYSQGVVYNDLVFTSGQIAIDPMTNELVLGSIEKETIQVMNNIGAILNAADMTWNNVIKCSIFLNSMNNFEVVNSIYSSYFDQDFPARETVEVSCLPKNVNVEISFIAIED